MKKFDIDVNDPIYGAWVDETMHRFLHGVGNYNREWKKFLARNPSKEQVLERAKELMNQHNITTYF